ncbi:DNA repair protein RecO [Candidatus Saccharibacteria bacterium CG_4_10_14_0_2_um_filter_52_9]|nr:MAG: DNA repair protein RecO [Candidatus Saccharibacteria bacterium CG_4_10_14_0_2_um_filter_52_9]
MKQLVTQGIVLSRTDYGEADRIVTLLTPEQGKLRLMVRGVRRMKSKMAGGIELFSVSDLTYIKGKGEIGTLISARLNKYYREIVKDIDRVQLGYELIKLANRVTEDNPEAEYFTLLNEAFQALNDPTIDPELIRAWFQCRLLKQAGHSPNLKTDSDDQPLTTTAKYNFDFENMAFMPHPAGNFTADDIKVLRLLFSSHSPASIGRVQGVGKLINECAPLIMTMMHNHLRV